MAARTDRVGSFYVYVEVMPGMGMTPPVTGRSHLLPAFDELARQHARSNGCAVELGQFLGPEIILKIFGPEGGA